MSWLTVEPSGFSLNSVKVILLNHYSNLSIQSTFNIGRDVKPDN